jgi:aminoglycoside phosphotransferase (APT) family kinase protein
VPLGLGVPGAGFPMPWSVYSWLPGANAFDEPLTDLAAAAHALGGFITALRAIDPVDGPPSSRGDPILRRDPTVRAWLRDLADDGTVDGPAAFAAWDGVLALPQWTGPSGWLHGDLIPGNLLAVDGRLTAVIDFGGVGVGDPACDLMPAWNLFDGPSREVFRAAVDVDDDTWARGRGWALCFGVGAYHYYRVTNPALAAVGHRSMRAALADFVNP